ncbi:MAG TPA: hypothetical protein VFW24_17615 [Acidimicrobiales bacterium]|nr:hypothetical protein [Acidimicrobiales bacterium]
MLVSYVLRLVPDQLSGGRLVGEVEAVNTGERRAIHGADELLGFCTESYREAQSAARWQETKTEG